MRSIVQESGIETEKITVKSNKILVCVYFLSVQRNRKLTWQMCLKTHVCAYVDKLLIFPPLQEENLLMSHLTVDGDLRD